MREQELRIILLKWSKEQADKSQFKDHDVSVRRTYQLGVIIGLLASVCENDFYAKNLVLRKLCLKD